MLNFVQTYEPNKNMDFIYTLISFVLGLQILNTSTNTLSTSTKNLKRYENLQSSDYQKVFFPIFGHDQQRQSKTTNKTMKLFNKQSSSKKAIITIPEESFIAIEPVIDGHQALTIINTSLKDFAHKEVFSWNLSIIFHFEDAEENGMPKDDGMERIQQFCEDLEKQFNEALGKPNALFTFRETYNGISHVTWRVYDSDIIEEVLQKVIEEENYPFDFEYRLEDDKDWELVAWYLQDFKE